MGEDIKMAAVGEVLWDLFPGSSHLGGSAANVAFHGAQLGAKSLLISRVGNDSAGRRALRDLASSGVDVSGVGIDPVGETGYVKVHFDESSEPHFDIGNRVAWDRIEIAADLLARLEKVDVLCVGTLAQRSKLVRGRVEGALQSLRRLGHRKCLGGHRGARPLCILDLNLRPPFTDRDTVLGAIRQADVVKLNEQEARWLAGAVGTDNPVRWLLESHPIELVALTRGEHGAELHGRAVRAQAAGIPSASGDTVGAGDSFVAALGYGLAAGGSLLTVLEFANRRAAWVAGQAGAMPRGVGPTWSR